MRARRLLVASLLSAGSFFAYAAQLVEGLIEVSVHQSGKPVVGAQITTCADGAGYLYSPLRCRRPIETRTNAEGRFSFSQITGGVMSREERMRNPNRDPRWSYGFRIDYNGMAALVVSGGGLGTFGQEYVRVDCDFDEFLKDMKLKGVRPIADPDHMPVMKCRVLETRAARP
jgi:hypothetical protein